MKYEILEAFLWDLFHKYQDARWPAEEDKYFLLHYDYSKQLEIQKYNVTYLYAWEV